MWPNYDTLTTLLKDDLKQRTGLERVIGKRSPNTSFHALAPHAMTMTWSNFQSLIQLSIALNATFAAFGTYAGGGLTKEQARLETISHNLASNLEELPATDSNDIGGWAEVELLQGKCVSLTRDYEDLIHGYFRIICIAISALEIPLLAYSSYAGGSTMSCYWALLIAATYLPFYFGLFAVGRFSFRSYRLIIRPRIRIESRLITL